MYNGTSWNPVGNSCFSVGTAFWPSIAFSPVNNQPYVAYVDNGGGNNYPYVESYVQEIGAWIVVGGGAVANVGATWTSLAFNESNNNLYIAYVNTANQHLTIEELIQGSWNNVYTSSGLISTISSLVFDLSTGNGYIAAIDINNDIWLITLPASGDPVITQITAPAASKFYAPSIAISPYSHQPYVAVTTGSAGSNSVSVYEYSGPPNNSWTSVGSQPIAGVSDINSLAFNPLTMQPYLANLLNNSLPSVMYFNSK